MNLDEVKNEKYFPEMVTSKHREDFKIDRI